MSESERPELSDLSSLAMKPAWVSELEKPSAGSGPPRHDEEEPRRDSGFPQSREKRRQGSFDRDHGRPPRFSDRGDRRDRREPRDRRGPRDHQELPAGPSPELVAVRERVEAQLQPSDRSVEALCREIRQTGRAYSIFDLAKVLLNGADRYEVQFRLRNGGTDPFYQCLFDHSLWMTREEAVRHIIGSTSFEALYRPERVKGDEPKGSFQVVAVCGLSGTVLGPPNYHAYGERLRELHRQRYSRMPIEEFRGRVQMVRDEEMLQKWMEAESWSTQYVYSSQGGDAQDSLVFPSLREAQRHLLDHHEGEFLRACRQAVVPGDLAGSLLAKPLLSLLRDTVQATRRNPLPLVRSLSQRLEGSGLKFFKRNRKETFVSAARPRPIPANAAFSERITRIVDQVRAHPGATLGEAAAVLAPRTADSDPRTPTAEELDFLKDLRWLIREGYIVEYGDTRLDLAPARLDSGPGGAPRHPRRPKEPAKPPAGRQTPASAPKSEAQAGANGLPDPETAVPPQHAAIADDKPGADREQLREEPVATAAVEIPAPGAPLEAPEAVSPRAAEPPAPSETIPSEAPPALPSEKEPQELGGGPDEAGAPSDPR